MLERFINRYTLLPLTIICLIITYTSTIYASENNIVQCEGVKSINIYYSTNSNGFLQPNSNTQLKKSQYMYYSENSSIISYILHYINALNLIDDGKNMSGGDLSSGRLLITYANNDIRAVSFFSNRFIDGNGKQYAIDDDDYYKFWDFIYALKTEKVVIDNNINIKPSGWSKESVEKAISNNLVPKWNQVNYIGNITRLEVCQLIENLLNKDGYINAKLELSPFSDTKDKSVTLSRALNIISGKSDTEFCPYDYITREEFSKILSQTYKLMLKDDSPILTVQYKDKEQISDWAVESVGIVTTLDLMQGDENGKFNPKDNITKEQVIMTLLRLDELNKQ